MKTTAAPIPIPLNFLERNIQKIALVPFALLFLAAVALYFDLPAALNKPQAKAIVYQCPMHLAVVQTMPGSCPECGMALTMAPGRTKPVTDHPAGHDSDGCCPKKVKPAPDECPHTATEKLVVEK